jgi:hypothetical protein
MYIEAIIIGFILGIIRNGRLNNFSEMRFRGGIPIIVAFIAFVMPYILGIMGISYELITIFPYAAALIALFVAILNFDKSGMKLIIVGGLINVVIMGLNHFQMPVDLTKMSISGLDALVLSVKEGTVINYVDVVGAHFLSPFLGKVLVLPSAYPFNKLLSLGDILMSLGIVFLVQGEMMMFSSRKRGSMITFQYNSRKH